MNESTVEPGSDELPPVDAGPAGDAVVETETDADHEPGKDASGPAPGNGDGADRAGVSDEHTEGVKAGERVASKPPVLTQDDADLVENIAAEQARKLDGAITQGVKNKKTVEMIEGSEAHAEGGIPKLKFASSEGGTTDGAEKGDTDVAGPSGDNPFETPMDPGFLPNMTELVRPEPPQTPDEREAADPTAWKRRIDHMVEDGLLFIGTDGDGNAVAYPMTVDGCRFSWLNDYVGLVEIRANHEAVATDLVGALISEGWTMMGLDGGMILLEAPQSEQETAQRPPTPIDRLGQGSTPFFNS